MDATMNIPAGPGLPPKKSSGVLKGCLIVAGVFALILLIGGIYIAMNLRGWVASGAETVLVELVNQSPLPEEQKLVIRKRVGELSADFKSGKITLEELGNVIESLSNSPVVAAAGVMFVDSTYIVPSTLDEAEKKDARLAAQRFARGVFEKKISQTAIDQAVAMISEPDPQHPGHTKPKSKLTDAELQALVVKLKKEADSAEIPNEPFEINFADEINKAIDAGLVKTRGAKSITAAPSGAPVTK